MNRNEASGKLHFQLFPRIANHLARIRFHFQMRDAARSKEEGGDGNIYRVTPRDDAKFEPRIYHGCETAPFKSLN